MYWIPTKPRHPIIAPEYMFKTHVFWVHITSQEVFGCVGEKTDSQPLVASLWLLFQRISQKLPSFCKKKKSDRIHGTKNIYLDTFTIRINH